MLEVKLQINERGRGAFFLKENIRQLGEMQIGLSEKILTVYHTEVVPELQGKGGAKKLFETMIDYAPNKKLKVNPLCPYVLSVFKKNPDQYDDLWKLKNSLDNTANS